MLVSRLRQAGFTLIELMVVIAIIGVLMTAGLIAFRNAQQGARDAKRRADVDAISKAFEQYNNQNAGQYPLGSAWGTALATYFSTATAPTPPAGTTQTAYTVTTDTLGTAPNQYGSKYCVCALLESAGKGNATADAAANGVCTFGATSPNYFCAANRQ